MSRPLSERNQQILESLVQTGSVRTSARELRLSRDAVRNVWREHRPRIDQRRAELGLPPWALRSGGKMFEPLELKHDEAGNDLRVEYSSDERIRTLEDALRYAQVDTTVWRVDRWECSSHEVVLRPRAGSDERGRVKPDRIVRKTCWRVKLYLKRLVPKPWQDAVAALTAKIRTCAPKYPKFQRGSKRGGYLLEIDVFDAHLGKLAWAPEAGESYDLKIAERLYTNAIRDLLAHAAGYSFERILFPIGNDFFHCDNPSNTTVNGTPQDVDGRLAKIHEVGTRINIAAIERMLVTAPVHVVYVGGNHDRWTSYYLVRILEAWFRNCRDVAFDCGPAPRKYYRYGTNLIGLTHGDEEKHTSLPALMATERPQDWAETTSREWHIGHRHITRKLDFASVDTHDGVVVRTLRSLSASDAWHRRRGYLGGTRAAEAYVWSKDQGYVGHFVANARDS